MSVINQPDELGALLRDFDRRLRDLERTSQQAFALRVPSASNPNINSVEVGHLLANGISPAQDGIRVNDPSTGAPLFDTLGLMAGMKVAGAQNFGATSQAVTANTLIPGATVTFTIARQGTLLFLADLVARTSGGIGKYYYASLWIDGVWAGATTPSTFVVHDNANVGFTTSMLIGSATLAAGAHTLEIRGRGDTGQTLDVNSGDLYVIQMGG